MLTLPPNTPGWWLSWSNGGTVLRELVANEWIFLSMREDIHIDLTGVLNRIANASV